MRLLRPMLIGVLLGTAATFFLSPRAKRTRRITAKVKQTINLLNDLSRSKVMAARKQG
ncbi:MAG TPA: hypothetical protein VN426_16415 [Syntrophomonadaceae bacterium]|nr:hypothetical protein [Syntrophomonadaceae bacterium]